MEVWKNIDKYEVSNYGQVRNPQTKRLYKLHYDKDGYLICGQKKVHRLVASAFIPNPDNYPEVNHKDFQRDNNSVDNLEWCNHQTNCQHSSSNYGKHCQILTHEQAEEIRRKYGSDGKRRKQKGKTYSLRSLAQEYKCAPETIRKIILNHTYIEGGGAK